MYNLFGVSVLHQQTADLRLFAQIWDGKDGRIVWERSGDISKKKRSLVRDRTIDLQELIQSASKEIVNQLPN